MTAEKFHLVRRMKSMPVGLEFEQSNIDAENGIIRDIVMVEEGEAKGHGVHLESEFVTNLVAFDKAHFSERGIKARLGHPGLSSDPQGTQLGFMKNVRRRKSESGKMQAIADLHLLDAADNSPAKPGMKTWVLQMAAESPNFIMSSIVFKPSGYYQRKANGNKLKMEFDEWGDLTNYNPDLGNIYAEFDAASGAAHYYTDLVESGAATDHLFSNEANPHLFVARFGAWLDENPEIREFINQHPDKVQAFLDRIGFKPKSQKMTSLKDLLFGKDKVETDDVTISAAEIESLRTNLDKADTALANAAAQIKTLTEEVATLKSGLAETESQNKKLSEKVTELEGLAADVKTRMEKETETEKDEKSWMKDPINQRSLKTRNTKAE